MKENLKKRLDRVERIFMPSKPKTIAGCSDEELLSIIGEGPDVSDERLLEIAQGARHQNRK
jgi:hypothetical protein